MINTHEEVILNRLLDKYEKSKSFTGSNKVNQRFSIRPLDLFPEYENHANLDEFALVNEAVEVLKRKGYIEAQLLPGRVVKQVSLRLEALEAVYEALSRVPKAETNDLLWNLLEEYSAKTEILTRFCEDQKVRLENNKRAKYFDDDLRDYRDLLEAVSALERIELETYERDFSMSIFKDSKRFMKLKSKVEGLLFEYGDFPEKEHVLGQFNLVRTPTYVHIKGAITLRIDGMQLDFRKLASDLALSTKILDDIDEIRVLGNRVYTVENLTSFHGMNEAGAVVIYLGGFHNRVRREFIKKMFSQNSSIEYFHFGDIDAGGFYILMHLRQKTGVPFQAYRMNIDTLKQYCDFTKKTLENDEVRLKRLLDTEFRETIEYMLANHCKLEQEAVI